MHFVENIECYPMFLVGTLIFLAVGVITTLWAPQIQQYAIHWHEGHPVLARFNLFRRHLYSRVYLFELRLCGVFSLLVGIFCCWVLWVGK
jgi:hypothetical protein